MLLFISLIKNHDLISIPLKSPPEKGLFDSLAGFKISSFALYSYFFTADDYYSPVIYYVLANFYYKWEILSGSEFSSRVGSYNWISIFFY